jgi:adenylate kinase
MNLVFLGPPGSGKGTQAIRVAKELDITHLSTGDMLREAVRNQTVLGKKAEDYMKRGDLVPDGLIVGMIEEKVSSGDLGNGFILDGFPRTMAQAESLSAMFEKNEISLDKAILLNVSDEEIVKRIAGRAQQEGRADDTEDVVRNRLQVYKQQTQPIEIFYRNASILTEIRGEDTMENVFQAVMEACRE